VVNSYIDLYHCHFTFQVLIREPSWNCTLDNTLPISSSFFINSSDLNHWPRDYSILLNPTTNVRKASISLQYRLDQLSTLLRNKPPRSTNKSEKVQITKP